MIKLSLIFNLKGLSLIKCWLCVWWVMTDKRAVSTMKTEGQLQKKCEVCASVNVIRNPFKVPFYSTKENCCPFLWRKETTLPVPIYIKYLTWKFPLTFNKICPLPQSSSKFSSLLPLSGCLTSFLPQCPFLSIFSPFFMCIPTREIAPTRSCFPFMKWDIVTTTRIVVWLNKDMWSAYSTAQEIVSTR